MTNFGYYNSSPEHLAELIALVESGELEFCDKEFFAAHDIDGCTGTEEDCSRCLLKWLQATHEEG